MQSERGISVNRGRGPRSIANLRSRGNCTPRVHSLVHRKRMQILGGLSPSLRTASTQPSDSPSATIPRAQMSGPHHIEQYGPTAAILAGGRSSRMGRDKAEIPIGNETFLERTVRIVLEAGVPAIVIGRPEPTAWRFDDVRCVEDDVPGRGPIGGLLTAFHTTGTDILLLPCDLPDLTPDAVRWLLNAWNESSGSLAGLVPVTNGRPEPMFALYTAALANTCRTVLDTGSASLREIIAAADIPGIDLPTQFVPALRNVNRPDQLRRGRE